MGESIKDAISMFDGEVPGEFLRDSLRCLKNCYKEAYQYCKTRYPWEVAHDYRPKRRRAEFEREWPLIASRFSNMTWSYCPNAGKNCFHARIACGRVILTQSFVDPKVNTVRRAMFRDTYARPNYAYLFEGMGLPAPTPDSPLYAILMHDAAGGDQSNLCLAEIIFPDPTGKIVARIDLAKRFPDVFVEGETIAPEMVPDEVPVELIKIQKEQRKTS